MQFYVTGYTSSIRKVEYSIRISLNCVFGKSIIQTTNTLPLIRTIGNKKEKAKVVAAVWGDGIDSIPCRTSHLELRMIFRKG